MKRPLRIDGADDIYPRLLTRPLVVFAEAGGQVHDACALLCRDKIGAKHLKSIRLTGKEIKGRPVGEPDQLPPRHRSHPFGAREPGPDRRAERLEAALGHHEARPIRLQDGIRYIRPHRQGQVGRQRPWGRCPHERPHGPPGLP